MKFLIHKFIRFHPTLSGLISSSGFRVSLKCVNDKMIERLGFKHGWNLSLHCSLFDIQKWSTYSRDIHFAGPWCSHVAIKSANNPLFTTLNKHITIFTIFYFSIIGFTVFMKGINGYTK